MGRNSYPLNRIYISKQNLIDNYNYLTSLNPGVKISPVLKSNAYGHGIEIVGKILDSRLRGNDEGSGNDGSGLFSVDSLYEAYQLKKSGVKSEILIMGYVSPQSLKIKKFPFQYAVFDLEQARVINEHQKGAKVHLFVDTGMNREGIRMEFLPTFLEKIKQFKNLKIAGLMSHLAVSGNPEAQTTKTQIQNFKKAKDQVLSAGFTPKWFHLGGSFALINQLAKDSNLIRCGRAIYGLGPSNLKPTLKLTTKLIQIKKLKKGESVGYSDTFVSKKDMIIGILPTGYSEGVDRRLSNKGTVLLNGINCQIIGLISMNVTTIDLTDVLNPEIGQEVTIFSDQKTAKNSFEESAKLLETVPHELLVHLIPQTRREVV